MTATAPKSAFRDWLDRNLGPTVMTTEIVEAAAGIFNPARFSKVIRRKEPPPFRKIHSRVVKFIDHGRWFEDHELAAYLHVSVSNAGARRRDLRKLGYIIQSREVRPGTWQYRLASSPAA